MDRAFKSWVSSWIVWIHDDLLDAPKRLSALEARVSALEASVTALEKDGVADRAGMAAISADMRARLPDLAPLGPG
jgi:hypothetical protein